MSVRILDDGPEMDTPKLIIQGELVVTDSGRTLFRSHAVPGFHYPVEVLFREQDLRRVVLLETEAKGGDVDGLVR